MVRNKRYGYGFTSKNKASAEMEYSTFVDITNSSWKETINDCL